MPDAGTRDEPIVWYEGAGTADRRWLLADERGSVIAVTNGSGDALDIKAYDEYGIPSDTTPANAGRFGYTGQAWLPSIGMNYYKARIYSPTLGRFLQTDPIGYGDGLNWYNYVRNDPINLTDPLGLGIQYCGDGSVAAENRIENCDGHGGPGDIVTDNAGGGGGSFGGGSFGWGPFGGDLFSGGSSGGSGSLPASISLPPLVSLPQNTQPKPPTCGNGLAAKIANVADKVSLYSGGIATTSGALGLATAPTGAGFAGFEGVAVVSGAVSLGASAVGAVAHAFNGDYIGAGLDLAGFFAGPLAGRLAGNAYASGQMFGDLSASQARQAGLVGSRLGTAAGAAGSLYNCR